MLAEQFESLPETRIELEKISKNLNVDPGMSLYLGDLCKRKCDKIFRFIRY